MPKGPKGEKRPADAVSNAVKVGRIAVGEEQEDMSKPKGASAAASELGKLGGAARAKSLSATKRAEIARKAAESRWRHKDKK